MTPIQLNGYGNSHSYQIGEDEIYFCQDEQRPELIIVAHSDTGEPYGRTNQYIRFASLEEAGRFLEAALHQGACPHGWQ